MLNAPMSAPPLMVYLSASMSASIALTGAPTFPPSTVFSSTSRVMPVSYSGALFVSGVSRTACSEAIARSSFLSFDSSTVRVVGLSSLGDALSR